MGDATWHHGWTLHSAPPNDGLVEGPDGPDGDPVPSGSPPRARLALTVSFVADGARRQRAVAGKPAEGEGEGGGEGGGEGEEGEGGAKGASVDDEDRASYEAWLPDVPPGALAEHPLLPLVWDDSAP